jgi:predicted nucleic acid-binding Zn ribbon protein
LPTQITATELTPWQKSITGAEGAMTHGGGKLPDRLSQAVTDLIALRGWARIRGHAQLAEAWKSVAGASVASGTRVEGIRRGVLQVAVGNSPLLCELAAYHKVNLLAAFNRDHPDLKIRDLKFVMRGNLSST